jgi:hypothetical protein
MAAVPDDQFEAWLTETEEVTAAGGRQKTLQAPLTASWGPRLSNPPVHPPSPGRSDSLHGQKGALLPTDGEVR